MNTFFRFFYEFISIFFDGLINGFKGLFNGFREMFNISKYSQVIGDYKDAFNGNEKIFVIMCVILLVIIVGVILSRTLFFNITDIVFENTSPYSLEEIQSVAQVTKGDNLFAFDADDGITNLQFSIENEVIDEGV